MWALIPLALKGLAACLCVVLRIPSDQTKSTLVAVPFLASKHNRLLNDLAISATGPPAAWFIILPPARSVIFLVAFGQVEYLS